MTAEESKPTVEETDEFQDESQAGETDEFQDESQAEETDEPPEEPDERTPG